METERERNLRICLISGALPDVSCGVGDYTDLLARGFVRSGHDVTALVTASPQLVTDHSYEVVPLDTTWSMKDLGLVAAAISKASPDVLHVQYPGVSYGRGFAATFAPWAMRLHRHTPLLATTFHEFQFRFRHRARLTIAAAANHLVIAPDPGILRAVRHSMAWRPRQSYAMIPVAANVSPAVSAARRRDRSSDELVVGYWGFQRPDKGLETLVDAFARLRGTHAARLVLAGDPGPDVDYVFSIKRRVEERGLTKSVTSTGRLSAADLSAEINSFDVCALPYRAGLTQNRGTYAGAVAHGVYVVTTSRRERGYEANRNTRFVAPGDAGALAEAILDAPLHPRQYDRADADASWDAIARLHLEAYARSGTRLRPPR